MSMILHRCGVLMERWSIKNILNSLYTSRLTKMGPLFSFRDALPRVTDFQTSHMVIGYSLYATLMPYSH